MKRYITLVLAALIVLYVDFGFSCAQQKYMKPCSVINNSSYDVSLSLVGHGHIHNYVVPLTIPGNYSLQNHADVCLDIMESADNGGYIIVRVAGPKDVEIGRFTCSYNGSDSIAKISKVSVKPGYSMTAVPDDTIEIGTPPP